MESKKYFFCYNPRLSEHFRKLGIKYILKAKSIKEDRIFTLYYKSNRLQQAIDSYNKNKT